MQTSLEAIATKAQKDKSYRFQNLYGMIDKELLLYSWSRLNKHAASGVDEVCYQEYDQHIEENIDNLVIVLKEKRYRAKLVRRQYIPKANGKMRPLGIPVIEDKLVQYAAMVLLQTIFEQDFHDSMFGYRKNRGAKDAVVALKETLQSHEYNFVVEADIKGYFDAIDHDWLLKMLEQRVDDKAFIRLIDKWLKAGVLDTDGKVFHSLTGTPQGGVISPVLANIYMHYVICLWFEKSFKKSCRGKAFMCVYADDFVCAFENRTDAQCFYNVLGKRLGKFSLELAPEKTNIVYFARRKGESFDFLGFEFRVAKMRKRFIRIRTARKKLRLSLQNVKLWCIENRFLKTREIIDKLNSKLRGYYNYFGIKGNSESVKHFFSSTVKMLYKWLNRRSQRRSYNWKGFLEMIQVFGLLKPYRAYG